MVIDIVTMVVDMFVYVVAALVYTVFDGVIVNIYTSVSAVPS